MNDVADRFAPHDIGSVFIYTHEAHPGEYYPHITSMEQKFTHARALRDMLGVTRPIVLDALDGACHRAYGSMPNSVQNTLEYLLDVAQRRKDGERMAPFQVERLDYRTSDREAFYAGLARNGPRAVAEFRKVFG